MTAHDDAYALYRRRHRRTVAVVASLLGIGAVALVVVIIGVLALVLP